MAKLPLEGNRASAPPRVVTTVAQLRAEIDALRAAGKRIGFVPTMGALHEGHLSLVEASVAACEATVVSIFVNPTQFGPHEDFDRYPRTLAADLRMLSSCPVDLVFAPPVEAIYAPGHSTYVEPPAVSLPLEGARRPGHFRGVATVVLKLFHLVAPDVAYFGRKDYQQTLVVRHMVQELGLRVEIAVEPTVREADGLALSSRNRYLSPEHRLQAVVLSQSLQLAGELIDAGQRDADRVLAAMRAKIATAPEVRIDYLVLADPETLAELERIDRPAVALVAAFLGSTRLIDNQPVGEFLAHAAKSV